MLSNVGRPLSWYLYLPSASNNGAVPWRIIRIFGLAADRAAAVDTDVVFIRFRRCSVRQCAILRVRITEVSMYAGIYLRAARWAVV